MTEETKHYVPPSPEELYRDTKAAYAWFDSLGWRAAWKLPSLLLFVAIEIGVQVMALACDAAIRSLHEIFLEGQDKK